MAQQDDLRVLSLIASATEIVCALGLRDRLVGRSHECDYPPDVRDLPQATQPRFDVHASSQEIDRQVKALSSEARALDALGVYDMRPGALSTTRPTHIITQSQCDVCAVSLRDVEGVVAREAGCNAEIVSLEPNSLADIWEDFQRVGNALGHRSAGARLVSDTKSRIDAVGEAARDLPSQPTVAAIEWIDPLMAAGNWMPELIEIAGGRCLFGSAGQHSPWISFEDVLRADPDVILLSPCGFDIERTLADVPILQAEPRWSSLKAVRREQVFVADGNQFFNRPGPRLAESVEILAEILHPGRFDFGHKGEAWVPVPRTEPRGGESSTDAPTGARPCCGRAASA